MPPYCGGGFGCPYCRGLFAAGRVSQGKLVLGEGLDKAGFKDLCDVEQKQGIVHPARSNTQTQPWSQVWGGAGERLVAGPLSMGSGQVQPEKETWVRPHVGPQPTGGAIEVWCYVDWVAVKGRGLSQFN